MDLCDETCEVCQIGAPLITEGELEELLPKIPQWQLVDRNGTQTIEREYAFSDFVSAQAFAIKVGELAESVGHHPAVLIEWGKTTVTWWTHKINGLHRTDLVMAARTDKLL